MPTWWPGHDAGDRAAAAGRALRRAEDATTAALGHLLRAGDVDWTGPGSAGYRDELAAALAGVRLLRTRLREAEDAVAQHAALLRDLEDSAAAGSAPGTLPLLTTPALRGVVPVPWAERRPGPWAVP